MNSKTPLSCIECGAASSRYKCTNCLREAIKQFPLITGYRRVRAKAAKLKTFPEWCDVHGETLHSTDTGECRKCEPRQLRGNPIRIAARHAGEPHYPDRCERHGPTPHYVLTGRCSRCFTSMSKPRAAERTRGAPHPDASTVIIAKLARHSPSLGDWAAAQFSQDMPLSQLRKIFLAAAEITKRRAPPLES